MLQKYYEEFLSATELHKREFIEKALAAISRDWNEKNIFLIEAPTGYGKSGISYAVARYSFQDDLKTIICFPIRTLLEDQYKKFEKIMDSLKYLLGKRYMHHATSRYLVAPITLTTIDTLSLTLFGIPPEDFDKIVKSSWSGTSAGSLGHYLFSYSSIILSNIILDEVHLLADSTKSLNFLMLLIEEVIRNKQKLFLMSATIPTILLEKIKGYRLSITNEPLDKYLRVLSFEDPEYFDRSFIIERASKNYQIIVEGLSEEEKFTRILKIIEESVKQGFKRIITVFNTVSDAIEFFKIVKNTSIISDDTHKLLLHSRFTENDREYKVGLLEKLKDWEEYLIVATQVIEAGVDISSNLFITELAPANSLIQRVGRFLRRENEKNGRLFIWFEKDENGNVKETSGRYKVYDWNLVDKTLKFMIENFEKKSSNKNSYVSDSRVLNFHIPESYKKFMDKVYSEDSDFEINIQEIKNYFTNILFNLEFLSLKAFEKFFSLEGSFIRDELIVPVVPSEFVNSIRKIDETILKHIIPISIGWLRRLKPKEVIVSEKPGEDKSIVYEKKLVSDIKNFDYSNERSVMRGLYKNNIIAFIIDGYYDKELGLTGGE